MKQKTFVRVSKTGIVVSLLLAVVIGVWASITFHPVQASFHPGHEGEAEYNAWTTSEVTDRVFLPFVNSDPVWEWLTTVIVQNPNNDTTQVSLTYYDTNGVLVSVVNDTLPPYGSRAYAPPGIFSGSLVINTDRPIAVNVNETPLGNWTGDQLMSYRGVGSGDMTILLSSVFHNYANFNSILAVQNLGNVATSITLQFYNSLTGAMDYAYVDTLPAYSAHWYDTTALPGLPSPFNGFVIVDSVSAPVAGVVHSIRPDAAAVAHNNSRLNQVAYSLALPHLTKGYASISTSGILVYNPASEAATVSIYLYSVAGTVIANREFTLPAGGILGSYLGDSAWSLPDGFQGSALILSDRPVGALAQTNWNDIPTTVTGYSGVSNGETTAYVPYVRKVVNEVITQISVQNLGAASASIYVTYYDAQGTIVDTEVVLAVPPAAAHYFDQANNANLPSTFSGSAIVTSTQPIAAVGFISRRQSSQVTVSPTTGAILVYSDTQGGLINIQVPAGAVNEPTVLVYVPVSDITTPPAGFIFAGRAFDVNVYQNDTLVPTLAFNIPVTVTLHYTDTDIVGIDETELQLHTWNEQTNAWEDAACGDYERHPAENWLAVPICHLSRFALLGLEITAPPATIDKSVFPTGQIRYGEDLTYTLVISGVSGTEVSLYDPLVGVSFLRFTEQPTGIVHANQTITGTMTITPTNQMTVSFVAQVGVPGTVGFYVDVSNRACVYPAKQTITLCIWSNTVTNQAYRPYTIFLPLVIRNK